MIVSFKQNIFKDSFDQAVFIASLFLNLTTLATVLLNLGQLPSVVPLFYSQPWGEDQLVKPIYLTILPSVAIAVLITNSIWSSLLEDKFLRKILFSASLVVALLSSITIIKIILLIL